jgi:outer membrane immunogenic protein
MLTSVPGHFSDLSGQAADFGNFTQSIPSCIGCAVGSDIPVTHKYTENIGRVGLNYKF